MVATVGVGFCIDFTVFVELLLVGFAANHTSSYQTGFLVVTIFRATVVLVTAGCGIDPCFCSTGEQSYLINNLSVLPLQAL